MVKNGLIKLNVISHVFGNFTRKSWSFWINVLISKDADPIVNPREDFSVG